MMSELGTCNKNEVVNDFMNIVRMNYMWQDIDFGTSG